MILNNLLCTSFLLIGILKPIVLNSQKKTLSDFLETTHTKALFDSMNSEIDTIVINDINEPWVIGPMNFKRIKNKVILFEFGVEMIAEKGNFPNKTDALWKFLDCENIEIQGNSSVMRMNKKEYLEGEWRHVIRLRGCKNFIISDLTLRDSGGDGIAVGRSEKAWYSKNIKLSNLQCINNKRQGISITSAEDVWVKDSCFSDTNGTLPGAGVDIEPNVEEERIVNVNFSNCIFKNNYNAGIVISLHELTNNSEKVSLRFNQCELSNNFSISNEAMRAEIVVKSHKTNPVKGLVEFNGCEIKNSQWPLLYTRKNEAGFNVNFNDCKAEDICQSKLCYGIISIEVPHYRKSSDFGGYHFKNLSLDYTRNVPVIKVKGSRFAVYNNFKNVSGNILVHNPNPIEKILYETYSESFNENIDVSVRHLDKE